MTILDTIIDYKRSEVAAQQQAVPLAELEKSPQFDRQPLSLRKFLGDPQRTGIIAEFKRRSPSKGVINDRVDPGTVTRAYTAHGASCLSVLTDGRSFGGSVGDLQQARVNGIPDPAKGFYDR